MVAVNNPVDRFHFCVFYGIPQCSVGSNSIGQVPYNS